MSQLKKMLRDEWWILLLIAAGVVVAGIWNGARPLDAINGMAVGAFWFCVIAGATLGIVALFARKRAK